MSNLAEELYDSLDAAGFYVDYRGSGESDHHRLLVASPQVRLEVGQPSRRTGEANYDDQIQVLDGDLLIIDISGGTILVAACRYSGGFGPGDYQNLWSSKLDAIEDARALLIDRDIRMQAKEAGRQLHPRPSITVESGSLMSLNERLRDMGFIVQDTSLEARDTAGGDVTQQSALEVGDAGNELAYIFIHPRGFWCVRSFRCEADRWFGDFEHYWATLNEVVTDVDDFLRSNLLRRKAVNEGQRNASRADKS